MRARTTGLLLATALGVAATGAVSVSDNPTLTTVAKNTKKKAKKGKLTPAQVKKLCGLVKDGTVTDYQLSQLDAKQLTKLAKTKDGQIPAGLQQQLDEVDDRGVQTKIRKVQKGKPPMPSCKKVGKKVGKKGNKKDGNKGNKDKNPIGGWDGGTGGS